MHSQPRLDLNPFRETAPPVASGGILCGVSQAVHRLAAAAHSLNALTSSWSATPKRCSAASGDRRVMSPLPRAFIRVPAYLDRPPQVTRPTPDRMDVRELGQRRLP
jgi:hypothetical protein